MYLKALKLDIGTTWILFAKLVLSAEAAPGAGPKDKNLGNLLIYIAAVYNCSISLYFALYVMLYPNNGM